MRNTRLPTYFISHGGGPWPYMEGEFRRRFDKLEQSLKAMNAELRDVPRAILVVSGHWEERGLAISSGLRPGMVYDYDGFPEYLYHITYGAPGSPELAQHVMALLQSAGIEARLEPARGFDHGTFSIMKPLYPDEDIPVVQLSLDTNLDPGFHMTLGSVLAPLRDERVLIIGSGFSYHNLSAMRSNTGHEESRRFDAWLQETLLQVTPAARAERLRNWESAPSARAAHPREDHLIPLMVAVGAAGDDAGVLTYHQNDFAGGITASSFRFGAVPIASIADESRTFMPKKPDFSDNQMV